MKYLFFTSFLCFTMVLPVFSQHNNYDVLRQFQCEEATGVGQENINYTIWHSGYMNKQSTALGGKIVQSAATGAWLTSEKQYAKDIDSAFTARFKIDFTMRHMADRSLDASYLLDQASLNKAMEAWNNDIGKITAYNGPVSEKQVWLKRYNCVKKAIETVKDGYEPSGSRHSFYVEVLSDIEMWHNRLKVYLMGLVCHRDLRKQYEVHDDSISIMRRASIATACQASRIIRLTDHVKNHPIGR